MSGWRPTTSGRSRRPLRVRLGPGGWAEARSASLDAVTATWLGGFL